MKEIICIVCPKNVLELGVDVISKSSILSKFQKN